MANGMGAERAPWLTGPARGVALVLLAVLLFAGADVLTKHLAAGHPVALLVAVRYATSLALVVAVLGPGQGGALWRVKRPVLVILRALCLAAASATMALALRVMPVGETVAIIYIAPLLVLALSGPVLGEKVASLAWAGAVAGFMGVLLIARPGGGLDPFGVSMALLNAACATGYFLLTKLLSRSETTAALLFHTMAVGTLCFGAVALTGPIGAAPAELALMALLGVLAVAGHFLFTAAYAHAPASVLAPVNYVHLFWAGLLGWAVFGHVPDPLAALGMALVAVAGAGASLAARRG